MNIDLNQIVPPVVRSLAIGVVALPLALSVSGTLNATTGFLRTHSKETASEAKFNISQSELKNQLAESCVNYLLSKVDSKAERSAKDEIDEYFGGEMDYGKVCKWVFD